MLPITSFLSCTEPIDGLDCFSSRQKHHAKTYVTGLVAASNKTVEGISTHVLPAKSERALNKFITEYDWDEDELNAERLDLLQQVNDTRWSSDGVVIIDDTFTHKTGKKIPNAGKFYDHTVPGYIFGQNLIYALYADEKTTYLLGFRLYEKDATLLGRTLLVRESWHCESVAGKGDAVRHPDTMFPFQVFISEESAADLPQQVRWRDGLQCPRCRSESVIKYGSYREFQWYRCKDCDRTFNDKTETIFAHAKIALRKCCSLSTCSCGSTRVSAKSWLNLTSLTGRCGPASNALPERSTLPPWNLLDRSRLTKCTSLPG